MAARSPLRSTSAWCSSRPRSAIRVADLDTSLDSKIKSFDESVDGRLKSLEQTFDTRAKSVTETIDSRLGTARAHVRRPARKSVTESIDAPPQPTDLVADRRRRAGDPVDRLAPHPPHHVADRRAPRRRSRPSTSASPDVDRDHRRPQRPADRHHHGAVPGNPSGHRNPGRRGRHRYRYARRAVRGPAGFARRSRGRPHREQRTAGQRRPDGARRGTVGRDQVPCRGCGALADQPRGQYQRDHPDRRPRRAAVAAVGFLRRRRAAEADLGGSRARPHRGRHRRCELDPDQRPRCADHAGRPPPMPSNQIKSLSADVERTLSAAGTATASSIVAGAREAQTTLVTASSDAASQVKSLAADIERSLSMAGTSTAESITAGAREAQTTLVTASADAANQVKSLAADVAALAVDGRQFHRRVDHRRAHARPRARWSPHRRMPPTTSSRWRSTSNARLTAVGADTAASILNSAREAQSSLAATSADAASQIRAISTEIERSLCDGHRQHHRQHPDQRAQRPERAGGRLERGQLQGQVDLGRRRTLGARRQRRVRLHHDRQDRRNRHLRAAADRSSVADDRRQARHRWSRRSAPRPTSSRSTSTASPRMR